MRSAPSTDSTDSTDRCWGSQPKHVSNPALIFFAPISFMYHILGPRDALFTSAFLQNGAKLRVFGSGDNEISMVYLDNYCHGLMLGEKALYVDP